MKVLSYQQFSIYANGGGSRILRRLYLGRESHVTSLCVDGTSAKQVTGEINEVIVNALPTTKKWMRWYLRDGMTWLRETVLRFWAIERIRKAALKIPYDVLHIVSHGPFSAALSDDKFCGGKALWVSFHDHFSTTCSSFNDTGKLWNKADRRLVISAELGDEYQKLFGKKNYAIITDGLLAREVHDPVTTASSPVIIYFAGLLHVDYEELFKSLAKALELLADEGIECKLVLRGTQKITFLNNRPFEVVYKPLTLDSKELDDELNSASILYLPIKFTTPDFYKFSLSTKMVGYLGGKGTILYHGPEDSIAFNRLHYAEAAVCCTTLNVNDIADAIKKVLNNTGQLSLNAKALAEKNFNLAAIHEIFWNFKSN